MTITHNFVSTKPAAADPTQVGSAEWNEAHDVTFGTGAGEIAEGDHAHSGVYEPADATIVKTGNANWIDLTDGGATTLHSHAAGAGDVVGPAVAVDSNFAAFDTTTGKLIKDSGKSNASYEPADATIVKTGNASWVELTDSGETTLHTHAANGAPTDGKYIVTEANGSLSAEVVHPELMDLVTGSDIDMSGAATGTGVSVSLANGLYAVTFTNASYQYWDVASAIGTGNFDIRLRLTSTALGTPKDGTNTTAGLFGLYLGDSSRTASTNLMMQSVRPYITSGGVSNIQANINGVVQGKVVADPCMPIVLRISRSGTTVSFYYSPDNGRTWSLTGTATSSLNIAKVGAMGHLNSTGGSVIAQVHWLRSA